MNLLQPHPFAVADSFSPTAPFALLHDDALAACRRLPASHFALILTSPPYNIGKQYERQTTLTDYLTAQEEILQALIPLLKSNGNLCWQVGNYVEHGEIFPLDVYFYPLFKKLGLKLRNRIVWRFEHGLHASHRFSGRYETLLWFTKSDDYVFNLDAVRIPSKYPGKRHFKGDKKGLLSGNPLGKNPSDFWEGLAEEWQSGVWEIPNVKANHCEKTPHPCQFPVELAERCVLAFTNENDWILDPFAGVGSTLVAAALRNRRAVGIERDAEYCRMARQRLADWQAGSLKTRPIGKPIHKPTGREKVAQMPMEWLEASEETE